MSTQKSCPFSPTDLQAAKQALRKPTTVALTRQELLTQVRTGVTLAVVKTPKSPTALRAAIRQRQGSSSSSSCSLKNVSTFDPAAVRTQIRTHSVQLQATPVTKKQVIEEALLFRLADDTTNLPAPVPALSSQAVIYGKSHLKDGKSKTVEKRALLSNVRSLWSQMTTNSSSKKKQTTVDKQALRKEIRATTKGCGLALQPVSVASKRDLLTQVRLTHRVAAAQQQQQQQ